MGRDCVDGVPTHREKKPFFTAGAGVGVEMVLVELVDV